LWVCSIAIGQAVSSFYAIYAGANLSLWISAVQQKSIDKTGGLSADLLPPTPRKEPLLTIE